MIQHLKPKCHTMQNTTFGYYNTLLRDQTCHIKKGEQYVVKDGHQNVTMRLEYHIVVFGSTL